MSSSEMMKHLAKQRVKNSTPLNNVRAEMLNTLALYKLEGVSIQIDKNPLSGAITLNAIPIQVAYPHPVMVRKPGALVTEDAVNLDPTLSNLPEKAKDFIKGADSYGKISQKISILGPKAFSRVLVQLASSEMKTALELPDPGAIDTDTQGILDFANTIGINQVYVDSLFNTYLKSFIK